MNNQTIDQRILQYLNEEMSSEEMDQFEQDLNTNPDLKEAFNAEVVMRYTLLQMGEEEKTLQRQIQETQISNKKIRPIWRHPYSIPGLAASVACLFLIYLVFPQEDHGAQLEQLLAQIENAPFQHTYSNTMGQQDSRDSLVKVAYDLYDQKAPLKSTIQAFQDLHELEPDNLSHRFFLAFSLYKDKQYDPAIALLQDWPEGADYEERAEYVLVGAILKRNSSVLSDDILQAKSILIEITNNPEHLFHKQAKEIMDALP
ncbi:MAG: hypothetical protein AAF587_34665 [Bacteroidota bacterium]